MNALALAHPDARTDSTRETTGLRMLAKAQVAGAAIGRAGGVAAGIAGALLTAAGWLTDNEGARHWLSTAGSALLLLTIPLIILGAFCLDWMEKNHPRRRSKIARDDDDNDDDEQ